MTMPRWIILCFAAALTGCASTPKAPSDMAMLQVEVRAEPKGGYVDPASRSDGSGYGSDSNASETGPLAPVNYWHLPDIVVWIEPLDHQSSAAFPKAIAVQLNQPASDLHVTAAGGELTCRNDGAKPERAYLRSDTFVNLGAIAPGSEKKYVFQTAGLFELATDSHDEPITSIFVAPGAWVQKTHCNETINFGPLPPGRYRVASWHRRLPGSAQDVTLAPDATGHATVIISVNSLPKMP